MTFPFEDDRSSHVQDRRQNSAQYAWLDFLSRMFEGLNQGGIPGAAPPMVQEFDRNRSIPEIMPVPSSLLARQAEQFRQPAPDPAQWFEYRRQHPLDPNLGTGMAPSTAAPQDAVRRAYMEYMRGTAH